MSKLNKTCRGCGELRPKRAFRAPKSLCAVCDWDDPYLPGKQLVAAVERYAWREQREIRDVTHCLGINERILFAWRVGARNPRSVQADSVLIGIDRHYWDVWNEDTVRVPVLRVTTWIQRKKITSPGKEWTTLERIGERHYGDAGPDHEALETVRRAFEGGGDAGVLTHLMTPDPEPVRQRPVKTPKEPYVRKPQPDSQASRVLEFIRQNGPATAVDVAEGLEMPHKTALRRLRDLNVRKDKPIERIGTEQAAILPHGGRGRARVVYRAVEEQAA